MRAARGVEALASRVAASVTHPSTSVLVDALVVLAGILTYFTVRDLVRAEPARAFVNAAHIMHLEQATNLDLEQALQAPIVQSHTLTTLVNWVYIYGHWPVIVLSLVALYCWNRHWFLNLRNAMFVSGAIGFLFFFLTPVAPPRFADPDTIDTVTLYSQSYRTLQPPGLMNPYAAMPSLHAGWNMLVGIALFGAFTKPGVRIFAVAMPVAMTYSVVATGNHYVLDAVVGCTVALMGLGTSIRLGRRRRAILQEDGASFSPNPGGRSGAARRARPGTEPARPAARTVHRRASGG